MLLTLVDVDVLQTRVYRTAQKQTVVAEGAISNWNGRAAVCLNLQTPQQIHLQEQAHLLKRDAVAVTRKRSYYNQIIRSILSEITLKNEACGV